MIVMLVMITMIMMAITMNHDDHVMGISPDHQVLYMLCVFCCGICS